MNNVPDIADNANIFLQSISGFRAQEAQGRWMLGKTSSIELFSPYAQKLGLYANFVLPQAGQTFKISVNGKEIANFSEESIPFSYTGQSLLNLKKGINKILFKTNKSNNADGGESFAPLDKTDISVSFSKILIKKPSIYDDQIVSPIYNAYNSTEAQNTYFPIMNNAAELFFFGNGNQTLSINLLKRFSDQYFIISLDNKEVGKIESSRNQSFLRKQFVISSPKGKHLLSIKSIVKEGQHGIVEEASGKVAKISGRGIFYIQSINLSSDFFSNPVFCLVFSIILSLFLLYILNLFFLKKETPNS